jgi:hypothetical protein
MALSTTDRWYVQKNTGIGTGEDVLTNDELDDLYDTYADSDLKRTVLEALYIIRADASKLHDYQIATSSENLSQVVKNLDGLIGLWERRAATTQGFKFAGMRSTPPRTKDEPSV